MIFHRSEIEGTVGARFERVAHTCPQAIAIAHGENAWTYQDVLEASDRYTDGLSGRSPDRPIALIYGHDAQAIIAMMGTIRAGLPVIPIDPVAPPEGLEHILSRCQLVLTEPAHLAFCQTHAAGIPVISDVRELAPGDEPAFIPDPVAPCIIYLSSGTTGVAKGALRSHRSLLRHVWQLPNFHDYGPNDRQAHISAFSFGGSVPVILGGLLSGGTIDIFDLRNTNAVEFSHAIRTRGITILQLTPSLMRKLVDILAREPGEWRPRLIVVGGEQLQWQDITMVRERLGWECPIVHRLASSEAGIITEWEVRFDGSQPSDPVSVGYPIDCRDISIHDDDGTELPIGQIGEITVTGDYLASGYWQNKELSGKRFQPAPTSAEPQRQRLFTGDLGRLTPDGKLDFLGRKDGMVKIRGFRVELSAVEAAIRRLHTVTAAFVKTATTAGGRDYLVGYVQPAHGETITEYGLKMALLSDLPDFMVPRRFVVMEVLPLTSGGKVNTRALPLPDRARPSGLPAPTAPAGLLQNTLVEIWSELLEIDDIGTNDDFFDLGGDSLDALTVALMLEKRLGERLSEEDLLFASTIAEISRRIHPT